MDAARLIERWAERDARYARRWHRAKPARLSADECSTIVRFRISEALMLPAGKGRSAALRYLEEWRPPIISAWRDPLIDLDAENERHRRRWQGRTDGQRAEPGNQDHETTPG
jgi:hypothetical protein